MDKHVKNANKAIDAVGGNHALAEKLSRKTGLEQDKLYGRIRAWRLNGISLPYIRSVATMAKMPIDRLVP